MKTAILIALFSLPLCATVKVDVGFNFASLGNDDTQDIKFSSYNGPHMAVYYEARTGKYFGLQPGMVLEDKGEKGERGGYTEYARLTYLQFPLLACLRYHAGDGQAIKLTLGPEAGYLLRGKIDAVFNSLDIKDKLKPFDYGLSGGADLELAGKDIDLIYGVAYYYGLAAVSKEGGSARNRSLRVTVGIAWGR